MSMTHLLNPWLMVSDHSGVVHLVDNSQRSKMCRQKVLPGLEPGFREDEERMGR